MEGKDPLEGCSLPEDMERFSLKGQHSSKGLRPLEDLSSLKHRAKTDDLKDLEHPACQNKNARRLIETNASNLQSVVKSLASEGGLSRIQELVQQDFSTMPPAMKLERFQSQILPFLEIVSHPDFLSSLILEQAVGTIYNILYGRGGSRAVGLFTYIGDVLEASRDDIDFAEKLEVSCHVFSLVVELNSEAQVQNDLKTQAKRMHDLFVAIQGTDRNHGNRYLDRLLRRLEMGSSLPTASKPKVKPKKTDPSFVVAHEPPGGRHNNDHANICNIRIMPTYQEIIYRRAEYLPATDPTQWHIDGIQGLVDRNFRLLREDTIGQLRDAIHVELQPSPSGHRTQQRTLSYHDARIAHLNLDPVLGFYFEVQFPQPWRLRTFTARERQIWWQVSKRLQPGALVCLIVRGKSVIFCTVTELRRTQTEDSETKKEATDQLLWNDNEKASVLLHLVDQRSNIIQSILHQYSRKALPMSLVEFPGVLLPGFEPTLRALQSISESQNLPFPDLLLPADSSRGGKRSIPPPAYALKRGFVFNLRCLMNNGKDFHVRAGQPVDVEYLHENSSLDGAQAEALVHSLQHTIGIIQGSPGTGKSYTGVALIKALLANRVQGKTRLGPIICVTYTNHALDQLLEALIAKGVTSQIVRIGSRSKSERLQQFNIRQVAQNIDRTRLEKSSQWSLYGELKKYTKDFDALGLRETTTATRLQAYLRENYYQHYSALFGEDDDGYQIVTNQDPQVEINKWLQDGAYDSPVVRSVDDLQMVNPLQMCRPERQVLYEHWIQEMTADMHDEVIQLTASHAETKSEFDDIRDEVNLRCLNEAHIIGLTTSGLVRNLSMLRNLQSKVVLCEEAGEVLEAHLLTALLPSGEEAKVVIISLVRSNPQNRCGFLRTPNRINVLLSRAQHGMYIIGNSATSEHVPMWAKVLEILRRNENIGPALELQCPRHPDTPIYVCEPDDFTRVSPEGGCDLRCVQRLSCGHACVQKCHSKILHNAVHCLERCQRSLKGCSHECPKRCGDACPTKCTVDVFQADRTLECGHVVQNLPCWQSQNLKAVKCTVMVEKEVPNCHHTVSVACHVDVTSLSFQCGTICGQPRPATDIATTAPGTTE
ncbi:hypothetical protein ATERTT37_007756 [Aspergillus terreus]